MREKQRTKSAAEEKHIKIYFTITNPQKEW